MKRAFAIGVFALASCNDSVRVVGPPGSIALFLDTDAPLPPGGGVRLADDAPVPLFDRVLIEVFAPGSHVPCTGCVNAFELDADRVRDRLASVVIAPTPETTGYRARVRLFLQAHTRQDGDPDPRATIDVTVALPTVGAEGQRAITVLLRTDDVGRPIGTLDAPIDPIPERPTISLVGTWPDAARVPCADPPRVGEACVPGGAFWMGSADNVFSGIPQHDGLGPHLVVLSPFYLDETEMTVARFRERKGIALFWTGGMDGASFSDFCTMTTRPGPHENQPVNCMNWSSARAVCAAVGAQLPSEAQLEYVESGLGRHAFVWGDDLPTCEDAVFGRTGYGQFASDTAPCKPDVPPGGTRDVGSGARDRLVLETGTLLDLAGNVGEFARDDWNRHDEPCWTAPGVYRDPVCSGKSAIDGASHATRGGDWVVTRGQLTRISRASASPSLLSPELGFRCSRPASSP